MNVNFRLTISQRNHDRCILFHHRPEADRSAARSEVSSFSNNALGREELPIVRLGPVKGT